MEEKDKEYKRFTVSLPEKLYEDFEQFRMKKEMSRSDCIRKAMTAYMINEESINSLSGDVVGCLTMIMSHEHFDPTHKHPHEHDNDITIDHEHPQDTEHTHEHDFVQGNQHDHDYTSRPIYANVQQTDLILKNDIQHHYGDIIISTMHVHLEFDKCLEIVAVSGSHERVKGIYEKLQRLKSVLSIGFFIVDKEGS